jgi:hypothetical protein
MLRAAVLHPFLRGLRRVSTSSHPEALGACDVASWQFPRPDLHRSADHAFSGHTRPWLGNPAPVTVFAVAAGIGLPALGPVF